ncbi:MAG: 4Fe-4S binding protein [Acidobacteriia bacterium]|nr:4Fe-4S binding protein [Terriglobia bacterium]
MERRQAAVLHSAPNIVAGLVTAIGYNPLRIEGHFSMASSGTPMDLYYRKGLPAASVVTLLFLLFASFFAFARGSFTDLRSSILNGGTLAFFCVILFLILYTGHIHRWRRIFFAAYAVAFAISFVWMTAGDRGHMWLLDREALYSQAPMCHIVVPMLILPLLFKKEIIFPTSFAGAGTMILLVAAIGLVFGRAFCSWGCFFGGQDELFAWLARTRRWKIRALKPTVRYFSFGLLAFIILHSFATMSPTYCFWLCPFKTSSEFIEVNSFIRVIQTFMFVSLWVLLAVFLPLISKKRIQCGLFCPMGAFLSCTSKINLFALKIDTGICKECNRCIEACPTFSLTRDSLTKGEPSIGCSKCGACIESCPEGAIGYSTRGVPFVSKGQLAAQSAARPGFWRRLGRELWDPDIVFIFGIFAVGTVMASNYFVDSVSRLLKFSLGI